MNNLGRIPAACIFIDAHSDLVIGQNGVLFLVQCRECPLPESDCPGPIGNVDGKGPGDIAVIFLFELVDANYIYAVPVIVILLTTAAYISDQQTVTMEYSGGVRKNADADTPFF
jgi:hypothetical protein